MTPSATQPKCLGQLVMILPEMSSGNLFIAPLIQLVPQNLEKALQWALTSQSTYTQGAHVWRDDSLETLIRGFMCTDLYIFHALELDEVLLQILY